MAKQLITSSLIELTFDQAISILSARTSNVVSFAPEQPKSNLFSIMATKGKKFKEYEAIPASSFVLNEVFEKFLTSMFEKLSFQQAPGQVFETYTMHYLSLCERTLNARKCVGPGTKKNANKEYTEIFEKRVGLPTTIVYVDEDNIVEQACLQPNTIFCPVNPFYKFIDFAYSTKDAITGDVHVHAFQATIGKTHDSKEDQIDIFTEQLGTATASVYYLVPEWIFPTFVTNPVQPRHDESKISMFHAEIANPPRDSIKTASSNDPIRQRTRI
jgi:hypothetical protein